MSLRISYRLTFMLVATLLTLSNCSRVSRPDSALHGEQSQSHMCESLFVQERKMYAENIACQQDSDCTTKNAQESHYAGCTQGLLAANKNVDLIPLLKFEENIAKECSQFMVASCCVFDPKLSEPICSKGSCEFSK